MLIRKSLPHRWLCLFLQWKAWAPLHFAPAIFWNKFCTVPKAASVLRCRSCSARKHICALRQNNFLPVRMSPAVDSTHQCVCLRHCSQTSRPVISLHLLLKYALQIIIFMVRKLFCRCPHSNVRNSRANIAIDFVQWESYSVVCTSAMNFLFGHVPITWTILGKQQKS